VSVIVVSSLLPASEVTLSPRCRNRDPALDMTDDESGRIVPRQGRPVLAMEPRATGADQTATRLRGSGR
jgi:hypothetical protein